MSAVRKLDEDHLYSWLGAEIRRKRREKGLTQKQLADAVAIDLTRTSITNIESGIQKLPISLLFEICAVLETEPVELLPSLKEVIHSKKLEDILERAPLPPHTDSAVREASDILASIEDKNDN